MYNDDLLYLNTADQYPKNHCALRLSLAIEITFTAVFCMPQPNGHNQSHHVPRLQNTLLKLIPRAKTELGEKKLLNTPPHHLGMTFKRT